MKKIIIFLMAITTGTVTVKAQSGFTIRGQLSRVSEPSKVMLQYSDDGSHITDSALVTDGKFILKGKIKRPEKATLTLKPVKDQGPMTFEKMMAADAQELYIDKGMITIEGGDNMKHAEIKGGAAQKDYLLLQSQLKDLKDEMSPLSKKIMQYIREKNETAKNELFPKLRAIRVKMNKVEDDFIYQHPDSYVSFDLVKDKAVVIDPETFTSFFNSLSERLRRTDEGEKMAAELKTAEKTAIGRPAIGFTQSDPRGVPVSLASLRGKYVLIDFWASWCGPCRAENPNVVKAYHQFHDKNFEIVSVSLDSKKDDWIKAIQDDGLSWIQVSDLQGWKNAVAVAYGIQAVPQNLLVDPNGIIIAKNLRGEALEKKLAELIRD